MFGGSAKEKGLRMFGELRALKRSARAVVRNFIELTVKSSYNNCNS